MKIYLIRHAQTNYNELQLCNGDPMVDVHLTELGLQQAHKLAAELADIDFDAIFISELPRTRQTAEPINATHNKPIIIDKRINDNVTGYEGKPVQEWLDAINNSPDKWTSSFNNGESLNQTIKRVQSFLDYLKLQSYNSVLIVTHGFITQAIYGIINAKDNDEAAAYQLAQGDYEVLSW